MTLAAQEEQEALLITSRPDRSRRCRDVDVHTFGVSLGLYARRHGVGALGVGFGEEKAPVGERQLRGEDDVWGSQARGRSRRGLDLIR